MSQKHTQGPWVWVGGQLLAKRKDHTESVLVTADAPFDGSAEDKALIAAAPTLAEKLTNCVAALTFVIDGWDESDPWIQKLRATRDGAQAALIASLPLHEGSGE